MPDAKQAVLIAGPTASGKSAPAGSDISPGMGILPPRWRRQDGNE
jgi:hypothetical protein